jgi:asparaginyl-tRNA synthetase
MRTGALTLAHVVGLRNAVLAGIREHYHASQVIEVRPPLLVDVTGACENVDTLLEVTGTSGGDNGAPAREPGHHRGYLSQTGQLALEGALTTCRSCWCQTVSFRDDLPSARRLREFELIEEEFGDPRETFAPAAFFDELLERIERVVKAAVAGAEGCDAVASSNSATQLDGFASVRFPRLSYDESLTIVNRWRSQRGEPPMRWGDDLSPGDEQQIVRALADTDARQLPVFVTRFPIELKFFNMMQDPDDERVVLSADLLLPWSGEAVGSAVREDNYERLCRRLFDSQMYKTLQERQMVSRGTFEPYLKLINSGATPRHAGYGVGLDRVLQFIAQGDDIRDTSLGYRLAKGV